MADDENLTPSSGPGEPQSPTLTNVQQPCTSAQTGSRKSSSQSARPRKRNDNILNFDKLYGPKKFTRYYSILPNGTSNLTKLNMFKVDKEIRNHIGICEKITEDYANKSWTVEVNSKEQGEKLMNLRELVQEPITVKPHEQHNTCQGVITCSLLKGYSDVEIAEGLSEQGVTYCRRIIKNMRSEKPEKTATLILTFNSSELPNRITIRTGLIERVRPYIPLPKRCFKCHKYGHSGAKCRRPIAVCGRCGEDEADEHKTSTCQRPAKCCHCNTNHLVSSKSCPRYLYEKEVLTIKTKEHLTFREARDRINATLPFPPKTYASTAATKTPQQKSLNITNDEPDYNNNIEPMATNTQGSKRVLQTNELQDTESVKRKKENTYIPNINKKYMLPYQISFDLLSDQEDDMEVTRPPDDETPLQLNETALNDSDKINQQKNQILETLRKMERDNRKDKDTSTTYK